MALLTERPHDTPVYLSLCAISPLTERSRIALGVCLLQVKRHTGEDYLSLLLCRY